MLYLQCISQHSSLYKSRRFESLHIQIANVNCYSSSFEESKIYVASVVTLFAKQPWTHYVLFLQTEWKKRRIFKYSWEQGLLATLKWHFITEILEMVRFPSALQSSGSKQNIYKNDIK